MLAVLDQVIGIAITNGMIEVLLIVGQHDVGRDSERCIDPDDIVWIVVDPANALILRRRFRGVECPGDACPQA
ncbi:hypothetical protein G6F65_022523 [Rhizopus arrhizus]|nr:hypothetical protein G6F65_022523 [Rhizopus arrhizus]